MYDYEFINQYDGLRSTTGTVESDLTTRYFARCLYQRAISIFDFNLPKEWNKQYILTDKTGDEILEAMYKFYDYDTMAYVFE